ncbi:hypothetical protein A7U60_g2783 [Sanghuangporus baumii]|uniref:CHCH domain-containing protein n=1 Tax=Sanghuangporus baumii TaxID=108892 RepID=A0A9Q5I1V5_SANBA|nr:hypothetical protein A7U60_g2783 [Sanghuangporus baumii]
MPRQSRSRPAARPAAPAQSRSHTTAAAPAPGYGHSPAAPAPPTAAAPSREPGMLTQMAANMGSVAAGSVIGHGISRAIFGGSEAAPAPAPEPAAQAAPVQQTSGISCDVQAKNFTQCLEKADLPSCSWYLEQLKACQAAAAPY